MRSRPLEAQDRALGERLCEGALTSFGRAYGLSEGMGYEEFARRVPIFDYEAFKPWVERMLAGERDVASKGVVRSFARSSGTTSDRSKYIPVTQLSVRKNHARGMQDVAALYQAANPRSRVMDGRILTLGGSCCKEGANLVGDLSAVIYHETLPWNRITCVPGPRIALEPDFECKCELIARHCSRLDVRSFAGVPSWNLELMRAVLAYNGKSNLKEVWPNLECFAHGGVSFSPYREAFHRLIPSSDMHYMETYNASEGFFAIADDLEREDMLLMLDYGTLYEFRQGEQVVPLEGVKVGETYAIIITSNNGLWRYEIGDTVTFTSVDPYRIRFAGRTRQFLNAFGEEVIVNNVEQALEEVCPHLGVEVEEYSVAPRFMTLNTPGAHEWAVEFRREPQDLALFAHEVDEALRRINSDYDAKRRSTLDPLAMHPLPQGSFHAWMILRGKNKVPRLMQERRVLEDLLALYEKR